ncbi:MAG: malonyl-[acyl-carrier protein] O-methyltransferase BioC [Proteobacteria bacterium]|nr:MAG: malonyl-[acyl-carrier protein] O-methyltransferase BioC [Pseudomonadota bacterium]
MSLEHHQIKAAFSKAAQQYEQHAVLQKEALERLLERVDFDAFEAPQKMTIKNILDLGCGTGWAIEPLLQRFPDSQLIAADFSADMLAQISPHKQVECRQTDAHAIDIHANSVDLLFSNLMLQWCDEQTVLREIKRALKPGGLLHLTTMGEHTLHELRHAWSKIDDKPHVNRFVPANDLAELALRQGFDDVIADSELITMTYGSVIDVMKDLKNIGAHNTDNQRAKGLTSPRVLQELTTHYQQFRTDDGLYPATFELVYLRAKKSNKDKGLPLRIKD